MFQMEPAHVEVLPKLKGHLATIDVAVKPSMKVFDAIFDAEGKFESMYPSALVNPFQAQLSADRTNQCYIISSVAGLSSSKHAHWVVQITDNHHVVIMLLASL